MSACPRRRGSTSPTELPAATPAEAAAAAPPTAIARRAAPAAATLAVAAARSRVRRGPPTSAIGELLSLWGAHYDAARGEPCAQAEEQGLRCLFQRRGSLSELRRVNWPAILSLVDQPTARTMPSSCPPRL